MSEDSLNIIPCKLQTFTIIKLMEKIVVGFLLFIWMVFTLILTFSVIGAIILFPPNENDEPSTWMKIGLSLKENFTTKHEN